jgi:hypothetical protein
MSPLEGSSNRVASFGGKPERIVTEIPFGTHDVRHGL